MVCALEYDLQCYRSGGSLDWGALLKYITIATPCLDLLQEHRDMNSHWL